MKWNHNQRFYTRLAETMCLSAKSAENASSRPMLTSRTTYDVNMPKMDVIGEGSQLKNKMPTPLYAPKNMFNVPLMKSLGVKIVSAERI